jgi:uncharacterized protein YndB with AHSA1/START domain
MVKKVLLALVVLVVIAVVGVAGAALTKPDSFRVERSATMAVPPEAVYQQISDFKAWDRWSPWARLDPTMKTEFGGTQGAPGATYHWVGNDDVGEGRMTVTEVSPPSRLAIKLEFIKPFAAVNDTTFTLSPQGGGTRVTWAMAGRNPFMSKVMMVFVDLDQLIGKDFEKGLAQLAAASATGAPPR